MTQDNLNVLTYDGENRVVSSNQSGTTYTYAYDGNGLRVEKTPPAGSATVYIFSGSKVIAEYVAGAAAGSPSTEYIYSGAQLAATITGGTTTYQHPDHLSTRVSTDTAGNIARTFGHYPFGEVWYETGAASKWKFTSYERDAESDNDYAMARLYRSRLGRFLSPDPLSGSLANPQSLNRYSYVLNDPLSRTDPTGRSSCRADEPCRDLQIKPPTNNVQFGNDIFDAIAGAPGTYLRMDQFGNLTFGFSFDLYSETQNFLDQNPYLRGSPGLQVLVTDLGTEQLTSGLVPEYFALLAEESQILSEMPKRFADDMAVEQDQLIAAGMDPGPASVQALEFEVKQMQTFFSSEPDAASWLNIWQGLNQDLADWTNRWSSVFPQAP